MKKAIVLFVIVFACLLFPQEKLQTEFDFARFSLNDSLSYVEFYYTINPLQLKSILYEGKTIVQGALKLKLRHEKEANILFDKEYDFTAEIYDSGATPMLSGQLGFYLPLGKYYCTLVTRDFINPLNKDSLDFQMNVIAFAKDTFSVSDIQLATQIIKLDEPSNSMFYKNSYEIFPNPSSVFGQGIPVIYFYAELYNLDKLAQTDTLQLRHILVDSKNVVVYDKRKPYLRTFPNVVEAGTINVSKMQTGSYTLVLALSDTAAGVTALSTKQVFVYNPEIMDTTNYANLQSDVFASEYSMMVEGELEQIFAVSKYIATDEEITRWEQLSEVKARQQFLYNFWKNRDLSPDTPKNEYKEEYFKRKSESDVKFSSMKREGWKSDRGRVYLKYGKPEEVERYPNQSETKPYEIWTYHNLEGGCVFVFADLLGFSDYQLIHSTLRGELRDDNWLRKISTY